MAEEKIYPKGLITFARNDKAPDFVLGTLIITLDDLFAWYKDNPQHNSDYNGKKQIKMQILKGKDGRINLPLDTFKPKQKDGDTPDEQEKHKENTPSGISPTVSNNDPSGDLPF